MSTVASRQKSLKSAQDPEQFDDEDDGSISSACSSSSSEDSKGHCSGTITETGASISKHTTSSSHQQTKWFDEQMDASHSSNIVLLLVVATAVILGTTIFVMAGKQPEKEFKTKFGDASEEITQVAILRSKGFSTALERLSLGVTDVAVSGNARFPFYTLGNMAIDNLLVEEPDIILTYAPLVSAANRQAWEAYSVELQGMVTADVVPESEYLPVPPKPNISESIYRFVGEDHHKVAEMDSAMGPFSPAWQVFPVPSGANVGVVNLNLLSDNTFTRLAEASAETRSIVMSELENPQELLGIPVEVKNKWLGVEEDPQCLLVQPVFASFADEAAIVGHLVATQPWQTLLGDIIQDSGHVDIHGVVRDSCTNRSYTYLVDGTDTSYLGQGDLHEPEFGSFEETSALAAYQLNTNTEEENESIWGHCVVTLSLYPTSTMEKSFDSNAAAGYLLIVILLCGITLMAFMTHDRATSQRQEELKRKTKQSNAVIASLFPPHIREKLFGEDGEIQEDNARMVTGNAGAQKNLDTILKRGGSMGGGSSVFGLDDNTFEQHQIADLFPNATVLFADISGFTAWSSTRDPAQVFELLEQVFKSFDAITTRRRVFKVETVGDCYLCVSGLPDPRTDHALACARVARDMLEKFYQVTQMLEVSLGPDTGELGLRVGMHSGPVTAGILRGSGGRYQLFGDTVNTASRIETTGERDKIHISKETAEMIQKSGKASWVKPRGEVVTAKGKGNLVTFWLLPKSKIRSSITNGSTNSHMSSSFVDSTGSNDDGFGPETPVSRKAQSEAKLDRLIFWVSESLLQSLRQVVALRDAKSLKTSTGRHRPARESVRELEQRMGRDKIILGEVKEVISMPKYDHEAYKMQVDPKTIKLDPNVETQLREFVSVIASLYLSNPFHNFAHCSHVAMSIMKLLSRIVAPRNVIDEAMIDLFEEKDFAEDLHDYTYGITSDPLTQFSVLLAAVIHDVDHRGIGNGDLCKENELLAKIFKGKSVAEQNSVDLAWQALMDPNFQELRDVIYCDATELRRFRQLLVNSVLATDIFDKELSDLRKARWNKAFEVSDKDATKEDTDRKATIVLEHLIQASDVSHTMQHWQVYLKWNEHFFEEQYLAYLEGRSTGKDPSLGWYGGEIWFYDNYVIPLAKKLKDCGVFGVSSDEYLNYAQMNREQWEKQGEEIVAGFVAKYGAKTIPEGCEDDEVSVAKTSVSTNSSKL